MCDKLAEKIRGAWLGKKKVVAKLLPINFIFVDFVQAVFYVIDVKSEFKWCYKWLSQSADVFYFV